MPASLTAARPQPAATAPLFSPFWLGQLRLPNRIVMAPLTRARADERGVPSALAARYYAQRAGAGLIIAEATAVSRQGTGYDNWPGLYTGEQEARWRTITQAVHAAGGWIFVQLFHAGRMSHPVFHHGELPVGPSPVAAGPASELYDGVHPFTRPRALRAAELAGITGQFQAAAERALAAGFDGVEVHAGNGYLLDQFLRDGANRRDDAYGGNPCNRARLLREVTAAVISVCGTSRVGVRISPLSPTNGMTDSDPVATFTQAARDLASLGVGYLHVIEPGVNGTLSALASAQSPELASGFFRAMFPGTIIAAGGHTAGTGAARIEQNEADLIAYGQLFIANPDLPARFRVHAPLAQPQRATFYGGGAAGYTDYPRSPLPAASILRRKARSAESRRRSHADPQAPHSPAAPPTGHGRIETPSTAPRPRHHLVQAISAGPGDLVGYGIWKQRYLVAHRAWRVTTARHDLDASNPTAAPNQ